MKEWENNGRFCWFHVNETQTPIDLWAEENSKLMFVSFFHCLI